MPPKYATAAVDPPTPYASLPLGGVGKKWPAGEVPGLLAAICKQVLAQESDALVEVSFAEGLGSGKLSVRDVVHSLAMSQLYLDKFGSPGNPNEAVKNAYRRLLAREGDAGGITNWTRTCQKQGIGAVIHGHLTSKEYLDRFHLDAVPFPPPAGHASGFSWGQALKAVVKVAKAVMHKK